MMHSIGGGYTGDFSSKSSMSRNEIIQAVKRNDTDGIDPNQIKNLKRQGAVECSTCASRKYKDGSDENVSFKSAAHISPAASATRVRAHEQEHVNNAYDKAAMKDGKVICASVRIQTAICPECGKVYTAGGVTNTAIQYKKDDLYMNGQKTKDYINLAGAHVDYKAAEKFQPTAVS